MTYTPPALTDVNFILTGGYTPPAINAVDFVLSQEGQTVRIPVSAWWHQAWALTESTGLSVLEQFWRHRSGADFVQQWSNAAIPRAVLNQFYGDAHLVRHALLTLWRDVTTIQAVLLQPWLESAKVQSALAQRWDSAILLRLALDQLWADGGQVRLALEQAWRGGLSVASAAEQPWSLQGPLQMILSQLWSLSADQVQAALVQVYDLAEVERIMAALVQPWAVAAETVILTTTLEVLVDGRPISADHVAIEGSMDEDVLSIEIHPGGEADYLACAEGAAVVVTITTGDVIDSYHGIITTVRIDEEHGATRYVVEAMSPAVLLGEPYGQPRDGELSGTASSLAAILAPGVDWQTVDWAVPENTWIAAGESPLELLKTLAGAVGAVVQSRPDGTLFVTPAYPVAVPEWARATPGLVLTEDLDSFSVGTTPDHRPGYNRYLIGDQLVAAEGLRLEETVLDSASKEVRGYETPWAGDFRLEHTGGDWVQLEDKGVEERAVEEVVEIVRGAGRTRYPIYSREKVDWLQTNLGTITYSEDGTVQATIEGESLLALKYTTRCRLWAVRDKEDEPLQVVAL